MIASRGDLNRNQDNFQFLVKIHVSRTYDKLKENSASVLIVILTFQSQSFRIFISETLQKTHCLKFRSIIKISESATSTFWKGDKNKIILINCGRSSWSPLQKPALDSKENPNILV